MKDIDRIEELRSQIQETRRFLTPSSNPYEAVRLSLLLIVNYIEFMVTPGDDDEEE